MEHREDRWHNVATKLGQRQRDKRLSAQIQPPPRLSRQVLTDLFTGDGMAKRICVLPAREQTRKWIQLNTGDNPEVGKATHERLQELNAQAATTEALIWGRLYGTSLLLLGADDGRPPSEPLDESRIRSFTWLSVLDCFELEVGRLYANPFAPKYGEPETYKVRPLSLMVDGRGEAPSYEVHESRVIRFDGTLTPKTQMEHNGGWADSIFVALHGALRDFWQGFDGAAHLLTDFGQAVFKVKNLADLIASGRDDLIVRRVEAVDMVRSVVRAIVIDAEEEFERKVTPTAGLPELLDRMEQLIAAVTGIPVTLLMGRSPSGQNATGESDIRLFYDHISSEQETSLRPKLETLIRLVLRSQDGPTGGKEPAEWSFAFVPLRQMSETERVDARRKQAETDAIYIDRQALHPEEVRASRFAGSEYSFETTLDDKLGAVDRLLEQAEPEESEEVNE